MITPVVAPTRPGWAALVYLAIAAFGFAAASAALFKMFWGYVTALRLHRRGSPQRTRVLLTTDLVAKQPGANPVIGGVREVIVVPESASTRQPRATLNIITSTTPPLPLIRNASESFVSELAADLRAALGLRQR
jgi:hypothetical protein